jgi:DNA-binding transcriptional regulator YiaG
MTPAQIKQARQSLGLTQSQLAAMLDTDPRAVRAMESDPATSKHRTPAPRMVRLLTAYLRGYRPDDWPLP